MLWLQGYNRQFLLPRKLLQSRFGYGGGRAVLVWFRIDQSDWLARAGIFRTRFGTGRIMLFYPSIDISRDAGIERAVGTAHDIEEIQRHRHVRMVR